jgi:hypothetical protein
MTTLDMFSPSNGVVEVPVGVCEDLIFNVHYAGRRPSISKAFGLYTNGMLEGICTFGTPPSHTMLKGVCGEEYAPFVWELNRLCLYNNHKNSASRLVGSALKMIGNRIVVSYADTTQGHIGYVYQATNFLYTGMSTKFKEIYLKSRPELHHTTHKGKTFAEMESLHGEDVAYRERPRKHRYVYITGDKRFTKKARASLKWKVGQYPKGDIAE